MNRDLLLQLRTAIDIALEATDENVLDEARREERVG